MRVATAADRPALVTFLQARARQAMFPLANLAQHGMAGGHPRAMRFWLAGDPLTGVMGLTDQGMLMPNLRPDQIAAARAALAGKALIGIIGPADSALPLHQALGLAGAPTMIAHVEPHFHLDLAALIQPPVDGLTLTPISAAPRAAMLDWCTDYDVEALGVRPQVARANAAGELDAWIAADSHRVLWRDGQPVARTGFNARLPGIVQVGAVYVPPPLRRQGLARAAVALHLANAQGQGVTQATLFAASDLAARAYRAIGFRQTGEWFLCLLDGPAQVPHG